MATPFKKPGANLLNNPTLSDVKIKQHYKGKVWEYHGHKAILARGSQFFSNAFTGNFKEATEDVIELHDDIPEYFEIVLNFLYTDQYDKDSVARLAAGNPKKRTSIPIAVSIIAEKYVVDQLPQLVAGDLKNTLKGTVRMATLKASVVECYQACSNAGSPLGGCLAEILINTYPTYVNSPAVKGLMRDFPAFGADLAIYLHGRGGLVPEKSGKIICHCGMPMQNATCMYAHNMNHLIPGRGSLCFER